MFKRVRELERQVAELKKELACVTGERDEAINTAVELCHINTQMSHHRNQPNVYHMQDYPATKLTGSTTPAVPREKNI